MNNKSYQPQPIPSAPVFDPQNIQQVYAYPVDNNQYYNTSHTSHNLHNSYDNQNQKIAQLEAFVNQHEISVEYAIKLRQLEGFDVVIIADDSGSMSTPVKNPNTKDFKNLPTRWQEMRETLSVIMQLSMILDNDGIDVYFLNRDPVYNVTSQDTLDAAFLNGPNGYTPIVPVFRRVLKEKAQNLSEKKLLIILATDGEPTDYNGKIEDSYGVTEITKLFNVLKNERTPANRIHTTILACTDDDSTMDYLENWDKILNNFDLVDDYYSEKIRIQEAQGPNFRFSRGDYIVKIMLGSIDKTLDALDGSSSVQNNSYNQNQQNSCGKNHKRHMHWMDIFTDICTVM